MKKKRSLKSILGGVDAHLRVTGQAKKKGAKSVLGAVNQQMKMRKNKKYRKK